MDDKSNESSAERSSESSPAGMTTRQLKKLRLGSSGKENSHRISLKITLPKRNSAPSVSAPGATSGHPLLDSVKQNQISRKRSDTPRTPADAGKLTAIAKALPNGKIVHVNLPPSRSFADVASGTYNFFISASSLPSLLSLTDFLFFICSGPAKIASDAFKLQANIVPTPQDPLLISVEELGFDFHDGPAAPASPPLTENEMLTGSLCFIVLIPNSLAAYSSEIGSEILDAFAYRARSDGRPDLQAPIKPVSFGFSHVNKTRFLKVGYQLPSPEDAEIFLSLFPYPVELSSYVKNKSGLYFIHLFEPRNKGYHAARLAKGAITMVARFLPRSVDPESLAKILVSDTASFRRFFSLTISSITPPRCYPRFFMP